MKIVYNRVLPFRGYKCLNFLGVFLFVRKGKELSEIDIAHEQIHSAQYKEMAWIGFLLWYAIEWVVRLCQKGNAHAAYRRISLEQEAYAYQARRGYLKERKHYYWRKFL